MQFIGIFQHSQVKHVWLVIVGVIGDVKSVRLVRMHTLLCTLWVTRRHCLSFIASLCSWLAEKWDVAGGRAGWRDAGLCLALRRAQLVVRRASNGASAARVPASVCNWKSIEQKDQCACAAGYPVRRQKAAMFVVTHWLRSCLTWCRQRQLLSACHSYKPISSIFRRSHDKIIQLHCYYLFIITPIT